MTTKKKEVKLTPEQQRKILIMKKRVKNMTNIALMLFMLAAFGVYATREVGGCSKTNKANPKISPQESVPVSEAEAVPQVKTQKAKVTAYYLHGNYRCANCTLIEANSRESIEANFKKELDIGLLEYKLVNFDEPDNRHYINDFKLTTKSLAVVLYKEGKQVKYKVLSDVWLHLRDKPKFLEYVRAEINMFLQEAR
jgi:hypothetical protein